MKSPVQATSSRIDSACLVMLLTLVGLRPLIAEQYDSASTSITRAIQQIEDASPACTLAMDAVILSVAALWACAMAIRRGGDYRVCGIEIGLGVVVFGSIVSCVFAGAKRLAVNGASDWVCCALLGILLVQVLRHRWQLRAALCVIIASAAAQAAQCVHQAYWSFPETEALYLDQRHEFWARQSVPLNDVQVELFEARMHSREAFGYLSHANVTGAHLALAGMLAMGVAYSRWRRRETIGPASILPALMIALALFGAAALTNSRGAMLAGTAAIALCVIRHALDGRIRSHPRTVFRLGWAAVGLAGAAVIGHGMYHGSLPSRTLEFRWKYWTAAARIAADHPLTGVGSGNFGRHYLRYKSVDSPEEVKNPHNFLVSATADWGIPGIVGVALMLWTGSRVLCRGSDDHDSNVNEKDSNSDIDGDRWKVMLTGAIVGALVFAARIPMLGSDDPNHIYFETVMPMFVWCGAYVLFGLTPIGDGRSMRITACFAILAFLVQEAISFATHVPGALTVLFATFAVAAAGRSLDRERFPRRIQRGWPLIAAAMTTMVGTFIVWIVTPAHRSNTHLRGARHARSLAAASEHYQAAANVDSWDSTAPYEFSRFLRSRSTPGGDDGTSLRRAGDLIDEAIRRDPNDVRVWREKALCHLTQGDLNAAVEAARRVVELYPIEPASHELLGECLAVRQATADDLSNAVAAYEEALRIDGARPEWERIRRLRPEQRSALLEGINELKARLANSRNSVR